MRKSVPQGVFDDLQPNDQGTKFHYPLYNSSVPQTKIV
jgi:hypothetical protein